MTWLITPSTNKALAWLLCRGLTGWWTHEETSVFVSERWTRARQLPNQTSKVGWIRESPKLINLRRSWFCQGLCFFSTHLLFSQRDWWWWCSWYHHMAIARRTSPYSAFNVSDDSRLVWIWKRLERFLQVFTSKAKQRLVCNSLLPKSWVKEVGT